MRNSFIFPVLLILVGCSTSNKIAITTDDFKQIAVRESQKLIKDGWKVAPGSISLENLVYESIVKSREKDENDNPKYFIADGNAVAQTITAAQLQANEVAKLQIASQIGTTIAAVVESNIGNNQISTEESASLTKITESAKNIVKTRLGNIQPLLVITRPVVNSQIEMQVRIAYSYKNAMNVYKDILKKELEKSAIFNQSKVDSLLKF